MSVPNNAAGGSARPIKLQEMTAAPASGPALFNDKLDLIQGVKVRLSASVGRADISVAELFGLKEGSVVPLDKASDEPVEVFLDDKLVGRGELVVVGDHFGIRFTEIGSGAAP
jgi:flagellar motor switch protein FliN/FliY